MMSDKPHMSATFPPFSGRPQDAQDAQAAPKGPPRAANASASAQMAATRSGVDASGGSCDYYKTFVAHPMDPELEAYVAEAQDIIMALGLNWNEANILKELWRTARARRGMRKLGHSEVRGAQKQVFFAQENLRMAEIAASELAED